MDFRPEKVIIGRVAAREYSVYDPVLDLWVVVGADGGVRFESPEPVSLSEFFPAPDAGTEDFAVRLLAWLRENAGTGEVIEGRWADCADTQAARAAVYSFDGTAPLAVETGLEFNWDFRTRDVIFEVRGDPELVDEFLAEYRVQFPRETYDTTFAEHPAPEGAKCVRVVRRKLFD